jgi:hypothetical protein
MFMSFLSILFFVCNITACNSSTPESNQISQQYQHSGTKIVGKASNYTASGSSNSSSEYTSRVSGTIIERHAQIGKNPADAIALWIEAALLAQQGKKEGWTALGHLTLPLREDPRWRGLGSNHYFVDRLNKPKNPCFRSLVVGATPENGYKYNSKKIAVEVVREGGKDAYGHKFFIYSSGADTPRPIHLKKSNKTDLWYINAFSSLYVDVKAAIDPDEERFE